MTLSQNILNKYLNSKYGAKFQIKIFISFFILFDNATFHNIDNRIEEDLNNNKIYITKTIKLGCFTNPIEEFFSLVQYYFLQILYKRIIYIDKDISKEEYLLFIKKSVRFASKACNYRLIFARAGLL